MVTHVLFIFFFFYKTNDYEVVIGYRLGWRGGGQRTHTTFHPAHMHTTAPSFEYSDVFHNYNYMDNFYSLCDNSHSLR